MSDENINPEKISGVEVIRRALKEMPSSSGVYRMFGENGEPLYIGKAKYLKNRVSNYANITQLPMRLQRMVMMTHTLDITLTASEAEALLLEANQIKSLKPRYNILLRDDKSFPYIHLSTDHAYPRISKYRGPKDKKGAYFGPFASAGAVNETLTLLQKAFLLRPCADTILNNRSRPCLQYQIKRCSAPCVQAIGEEEYGALVKQAMRFLSGKSREIQEQLAADMEAASARMEFEKAAILRDRMKALNTVQQQAGIAGVSDADVIVLYREGGHACIQLGVFRGGRNFGSNAFFPAQVEEKSDEEIMSAFIGQYYQRHVPPKELVLSHLPPDAPVLADALALLADGKVEITQPQRGEKQAVVNQALRNAKEALQAHLFEHGRQENLLIKTAEVFGLADSPARIEVYDNSHVSGTHAVGAMIVAGKQGFDKKAYRIFNIRSTELTPGDDYAMLREVLTRRFKRLLAEEGEGKAVRPDLVLIDGGAGQLSAAAQVFEQLGISDICYAAISKGPDRNAGREWFHMPNRAPFQLLDDTPVLHYLQRLRDEAHRFAIGAHRNRRSGAIVKSELDAISGIGAARKKALLLHFGSAKGVSAASIADIEKVAGINKAMAARIYAHFHGE